MDKKARRTMTEEASNDGDTFIERKVARSAVMVDGAKKTRSSAVRDTPTRPYSLLPPSFLVPLPKLMMGESTEDFKTL